MPALNVVINYCKYTNIFFEMKYFSIKELTASFKATQLGIKNEPTKQALVKRESVGLDIRDPLGAAWGGGSIVTSG